MSNIIWRVAGPAGSAASTNTSRRPPLRKPLNCIPCRQWKAKCDRQIPCGSCRRRNCTSSCSYNNVSTVVQQNDSESFGSRPRVTAARDSEREDTNDPSTTSDASTTGQAEHSKSPSSKGLSSNGTPSTATVAVDSHLRQFRWDAPLHPSVSDQISRPELVQSDVGFPFQSDMNLDTLLALLPPTQHCNYLVSRYFVLFSPLFHILHRPSFYVQYDAFACHPRSTSLSWLALLYIILALAVTCLEDDDNVLRDLGRGNSAVQTIKSLSTQYRNTAMKCLAADNFLAKHNMSTLQATVLLIYAINHSQGAGQSWTILGIALNMSIALGCHIDGETMDLSILDTQQRRRCWAGIMMLHAIQSSMFGLTDNMRLPDDQVNLPADVNDADITEDRIDPPSSQPTEMSYMLYKFQLYRLSSDVCRQIARPFNLSWLSISHIETQIRQEEVIWNERYLRDGGPSLLSDRDQAHWNILHCYANQLYLLINRPFLNTPAHDPTAIPSTFTRCLSAGLALVESHGHFCSSPAFRQYRWFTNGLCSFFALHGAVTIAACLIARPDCDYSGQCRNAFEEAVQRFSERQHESNICARALPVLNLLRSMLVLPAENSMESTSLPEVREQRPALAPSSNNIMELDTGFEEAFRSWTQAGNWTGPDAIQWADNPSKDIMEAAVAAS